MSSTSAPGDRWHIGKEVPLTLLFALFVQTAGWIWLAASQMAKLDYIAAKVDRFEAGQYTQTDARRDLAFTAQRHEELARRVEKLEERTERRL